jgi:uncharacterized membrane protein
MEPPFPPFPSETAAMSYRAVSRPAVVVSAVYGLLNPIPFGCFVAALVFDIAYDRSAVILWDKAAAWLIAIGLLFAIVPRVINLVRVWITRRRQVTWAQQIDFWLYLLAIVAAIFNSLVHSRDAYGSMPMGVWLSACTVILIAAGQMVVAVQYAAPEEPAHG